jgi:hypothetical protein
VCRRALGCQLVSVVAVNGICYMNSTCQNANQQQLPTALRNRRHCRDGCSLHAWGRVSLSDGCSACFSARVLLHFICLRGWGDSEFAVLLASMLG